MAQAPDTVLVLTRCRAEDAGHIFGLRGGDMLRAVDGQAWGGSARALTRHLARRGRPVLLTFQRGQAVFSIQSSRADLGWWDTRPRPAQLPPLPGSAGRMQMWEIVAHPSGAHDLFCLHRPLLALVAPPLWLAQARLWPGLALLGAAMALCLPVGPALAALVWIAAGLHLWQSGPDHQRVALHLQGYGRRARIAAGSERDAIATWTALHPQARFRYAPAPAPATAPELGSDPI